ACRDEVSRSWPSSPPALAPLGVLFNADWASAVCDVYTLGQGAGQADGNLLLFSQREIDTRRLDVGHGAARVVGQGGLISGDAGGDDVCKVDHWKPPCRLSVTG